VYGENYVALPMRHSIESASPQGAKTIAYQWRRDGAWEGLAATVSGAPVAPSDDSEEAFITEHYWGYARKAPRATLEYQVEHPRWSVWRAETATLECAVGSLYGPQFVETLSGAPSTAFVADGSPVTVRSGRSLR
jgi:hypothetical protein